MATHEIAETKTRKLISKRLSLAILISIIVHFIILILMGLWTVYQYVVEGDPGMEVSMETGDAEEMVEQPDEVVEVQEVVQQVEVEFDRLTVDPLFDQDLPMLNARVDAIPTPVTPTIPTTTASQIVFQRAAPRGSWGNVFGSRESNDFLLEGAFYDFKKNPRGSATNMSTGDFPRRVSEFVESGFNRRFLDERYFRAPESRSVSYILHPMMQASNAIAAYDLVGVVEPRMWIIHYQGTISAPSNGEFRFIAYADDQILVALDGQTVVDGSRQVISPNLRRVGTQFGTLGNTNGAAFHSDWIRMRANQDIKIDIIVGENPGGQYGAFLFVEKRGVETPRNENGRPLLPLFTTVEMDGVPDFTEVQERLSTRPPPPMAAESMAFPRN